MGAIRPTGLSKIPKTTAFIVMRKTVQPRESRFPAVLVPLCQLNFVRRLG